MPEKSGLLTDFALALTSALVLSTGAALAQGVYTPAFDKPSPIANPEAACPITIYPPPAGSGGNSGNTSTATSYHDVLPEAPLQLEPSNPNALQGGVIQERTVSKKLPVQHKRLDNGVVLINHEYDSVVETPWGNVNVDAGAFVLMLTNEHRLAVYDLHDDHKNSVLLCGKNFTIPLIPSHVAVLTDQTYKTFEYANPIPGLHYRHLSHKLLDDHNTHAFEAEFNELSMLNDVPAISAMRNSAIPRERKLMDTMLKTTAIMLQLTNSDDPYALYMPPEVAAKAMAAAPASK